MEECVKSGLLVVLETQKKNCRVRWTSATGQCGAAVELRPLRQMHEAGKKHARSQECNGDKDNSVENRKAGTGHILRMQGTSQTQIAVLGWFKGLVEEKKTP